MREVIIAASRAEVLAWLRRGQAQKRQSAAPPVQQVSARVSGAAAPKSPAANTPPAPGAQLSGIAETPESQPPPSPKRATKTVTMLSRDIVIIPPALWPEASNARSKTP